MNDDGYQGSKADTISDGQSGREEKRGIGFICRLIEKSALSDNGGSIVRVAGVVEGNRGRYREVGGIPGVGDYVMRSVGDMWKGRMKPTVDDGSNDPEDKDEGQYSVHLRPPLAEEDG